MHVEKTQEEIKAAYFLHLANTIKVYDKTIIEVKNLQVTGSYSYTKEIIALVKERKFDELAEKYSNTGKRKTFEDLTVVAFSNQNNIHYTAIFYDSDDLWQDPVVFDLFETYKT